MKVFCKEFITVWTRGLVRWLSRKFDSISIDLTPVEEKLDDVKSDVAEVKTAVEHIDFTPLEEKLDTTVAQETTSQEIKRLVNKELTEQAQFIRDYAMDIERTNPYAEQLRAIIGEEAYEPVDYQFLGYAPDYAAQLYGIIGYNN